MQPIKSTVLSRIYGHGRGWVFSPKDFADIADPNVVSAILSRLKKKGKIRRVAHGLYDYPRNHPKLGVLSPSIESVINALKARDGTVFQPSGAYAANALGLSEQVPAKVIFFTNGKSRTIKIAKLNIELKRKSEKNLRLAGTISGLIVESLRYLGEKHVKDIHIKKLARKLPEKEKKSLIAQIRFAPIWMRPHLLKIIEGTSK